MRRASFGEYLVLISTLSIAGYLTFPDTAHSFVHTVPDEMMIWESVVKFPQGFSHSMAAHMRPVMVLLGRLSYLLSGLDGLGCIKLVSWGVYLLIALALYHISFPFGRLGRWGAVLTFLCSPQRSFFSTPALATSSQGF